MLFPLSIPCLTCSTPSSKHLSILQVSSLVSPPLCSQPHLPDPPQYPVYPSTRDLVTLNHVWSHLPFPFPSPSPIGLESLESTGQVLFHSGSQGTCWRLGKCLWRKGWRADNGEIALLSILHPFTRYLLRDQTWQPLRKRSCLMNVPGKPQSLEGESLSLLPTGFASESPRESSAAPSWAAGVGSGSQRESSLCLCPGTCSQASLCKSLDKCWGGKPWRSSSRKWWRSSGWSSSGASLRAGPPSGWYEVQRGHFCLHSSTNLPLLGAQKSTPSFPNQGWSCFCRRRCWED